MSGSSSTSFTVSIASFIISLSAVLLIFFFMHAFIREPEGFSFNPAETCKSPPSGCWDGLSKSSLKCSGTFERDTVLRRGSVAKAGQFTCYKSIYFNLDGSALMIMWTMLTWACLTLKTWERISTAILEKAVRPLIVIALIASLHSMWYSYSVVSHYLNDRFYPFLASQIFFGLTETMVQLILLAHVRRDDPIRPGWLIISAGTAFFHATQMLLDERGNLMLRNVALCSPDIFAFFTSFMLAASNTGTASYGKIDEKDEDLPVFENTQKISPIFPLVKRIALVWVSMFLIFHLFFADSASFKI